MNLRSESTDSGKVIYLQSKFDFDSSMDFKSFYEDEDEDNYIVDFRDTDYMDSSGLGLLLNMKRSIGEANIKLINCNSQIKKILIISRFDQEFDIQ